MNGLGGRNWTDWAEAVPSLLSLPVSHTEEAEQSKAILFFKENEKFQPPKRGQGGEGGGVVKGAPALRRRLIGRVSRITPEKRGNPRPPGPE